MRFYFYFLFFVVFILKSISHILKDLKLFYVVNLDAILYSVPLNFLPVSCLLNVFKEKFFSVINIL